MKKVASIIGIVLGAIVIIVGISIMDVRTAYLGESYTFGADFFTEIYSAIRQIGFAINMGIEQICTAIGWFLIILGGFAICHFLTKLAEPSLEDIVYSMNLITPASTLQPQEPSVGSSKYCPLCDTPVKTFPCNNCGYSPSASVAPGANTSWFCSNCGAENSTSHSQCKKCGLLKGTVKQSDTSGDTAPVATTYTAYTAPVAPSDKWVCKHCNTENNMKHGQCKKCGQYRV